jgi:hypothetical protein
MSTSNEFQPHKAVAGISRATTDPGTEPRPQRCGDGAHGGHLANGNPPAVSAPLTLEKPEPRMNAADKEQKIIEANAKLIKSDDSEVVCEEHNVTKRWGDLSPIVQLAILAGLDVIGERCIMEH